MKEEHIFVLSKDVGNIKTSWTSESSTQKLKGSCFSFFKRYLFRGALLRCGPNYIKLVK